jgi:hypothetical protein
MLLYKEEIVKRTFDFPIELLFLILLLGLLSIFLINLKRK